MTAPAGQLGLDLGSDRSYADALIRALVPIARALATRASDRKITVANLRHAAEQRGLLTGAERGRRLSFIHSVFPKAGFLRTDDYRRSDLPRSHGNLHRLWYLPDSSEAGQ